MKLNKYQNYSKYKNGIVIPALIGTVLSFILYSYSRLTTPSVEVFLSDQLYSLAATVLIAYLACLFLLYLSIHRYYFSRSRTENDPRNLLYYLQSPFKSTRYKLILVISCLIYFVFFWLRLKCFYLFRR